MYSTWHRCCDCCRNWLNNTTSGARAAITAGASAMRSTTGARAAITAGAGAMYFTTHRLTSQRVSNLLHAVPPS